MLFDQGEPHFHNYICEDCQKNNNDLKWISDKNDWSTVRKPTSSDDSDNFDDDDFVDASETFYEQKWKELKNNNKKKAVDTTEVKIAHKFRLIESTGIETCTVTLKLGEAKEIQCPGVTRVLKGPVDADGAMGMFTNMRVRQDYITALRKQKMYKGNDIHMNDAWDHFLRKLEKEGRRHLDEIHDEIKDLCSLSELHRDTSSEKKRCALVGCFVNYESKRSGLH